MRCGIKFLKAISRKHFCFRYSLFVKLIIAIEAYRYLLGLAGLIKYINVTSYMYSSAFLTAICSTSGSCPQSFMVKFSKFCIKSILQGQTFQKLTS